MNEHLHRFTREFLASLRKDLVLDSGGKKGYFLEKILDNYKAWKAERLPDSDPQAKSRHAVFRFKYWYPAPDIKANHDKVLNFLSPALRAYCAGIEYLRSDDDDLFDVCQQCHADWVVCKKAIRLNSSARASVIGNRRSKTLNPAEVKLLLEQGYTKRSIAYKFRVTRQAVQKLTGPTKKKKKAT